MTQESEIVLREGRVDFMVFIYRHVNGQEEPIGTIEGSVFAETGKMLSLHYTDATSAKTSKMRL